MNIETWKADLFVLVMEFKKELALQKEGKNYNISKLYDTLTKIMIHYFGKERLEQIWDGQCLSMMAPLSACEIEFNDSYMKITRKTDKADLEINLGNNNLPNFSAGWFSRNHYFTVSENENANRKFFGDIIVDYTKAGDVVCFHHDRRIEPNAEPQEVAWTVAQLSRIVKSDLQRDDNSIMASTLKEHNVCDAINLGSDIKEHFSLGNDIQLYTFDYSEKTLSPTKTVEDNKTNLV